MRFLFLTASTFLLLGVVAGCGSSDSQQQSTGNSSDPTTPPTSSSAATNACTSAGTAICAKACACATDGKCRIGTAATDGGVSAALIFDDEQKCRDLYVSFGCSNGGEVGLDYATCESQVNASVCVDAAGGKAMPYPDVCKSKQK